nr:immunoglobulin light chain junction region [Macaca mulatta]MOV68806.1 immunoglobulin light chain junction region [Macaca mulatta]
DYFCGAAYGSGSSWQWVF